MRIELEALRIEVTAAKAFGESPSKTSTSLGAQEPPNALVQLEQSKWKSLYSFISWNPWLCRCDPANPPGFAMALNLLYAFAATFTIANQYCNLPILNKLAEDFAVSDERISSVPALIQAGYAAGLRFLLPLGDLFRRRAFNLVVVLVTATLWRGQRSLEMTLMLNVT